jgi:hypothetical protein
MPAGIVRVEGLGKGTSEVSGHILTGGDNPPFITLNSNSGYPRVRDIYARATKVDSGTGGRLKVVAFHIRFESTISNSARAIAFNVFQEDAHEFTYPFIAGKKSDATKKPAKKAAKSAKPQ